VNTRLVVLAALMWVVTYPSRALPLLAPGIERLPAPVLAYLRLVGPAVLAALAAVNALVVTKSDGSHALHFGITAAGVLACMCVVAWRRNVFVGLIVAVAVVVLGRAAGVA
jgi:branched-subunit amino acid transport protein